MHILKTQRLQLREIQSSDDAVLAKVLSDPEVMRYSTKGVHSKVQIKEYITNTQQSYQQNGFGQWLVTSHTSDFIGICGLNKHRVGNNELIHLMYRLVPKQQGKGYATEMVKGVVDYAASKLPAEKIHALIAPSNEKSLKVALQAGFKHQYQTTFSGVLVDVYQG